MKPVASLITWIKSLTIPAKVIAGVATVAVIGGGTTATVIVVNQKTEEPETAVQSDSEETPNDTETNEPEATDEPKEERESEEAKSESISNSSNAPTDKSSSSSTNSSSNTQQKSSYNSQSQSQQQNNSSTSQSQNSSSKSQNQQSSNTTKTADYNLNTPYYLSIWAHKGAYNKCWQTIGDAPKNDSELATWADKFYTSECQGQGAEAEIWGVGKSIAEAGRIVEQKAASQYPHYYFALKAYVYEGQLTEAYCNKYNLSCDRR